TAVPKTRRARRAAPAALPSPAAGHRLPLAPGEARAEARLFGACCGPTPRAMVGGNTVGVVFAGAMREHRCRANAGHWGGSDVRGAAARALDRLRAPAADTAHSPLGQRRPEPGRHRLHLSSDRPRIPHAAVAGGAIGIGDLGDLGDLQLL